MEKTTERKLERIDPFYDVPKTSRKGKEFGYETKRQANQVQALEQNTPFEVNDVPFSRMDLFNIPIYNFAEFLKAIDTSFKIDLSGIDDYSDPEKSKHMNKDQFYRIENGIERLNYLFRSSKDFLKNELRYFSSGRRFNTDHPLPNEIENFSIRNASDLRRLHAILQQNKRKDSTEDGHIFCSIVKIMLAGDETEREGYGSLEDKARVFEQRLALYSMSSDQNGETQYFDKFDKGVIFPPDRPEGVHFTMSSRSKELMRIIEKLIREPYADKNKILGDGIGMRFEAESKRDLASLLYYVLHKVASMGGINLSMKSLRLFEKGELDIDFLKILVWHLRS